MWAFILFNVFAALALYWLVRVPKKGGFLGFGKSKEEKAQAERQKERAAAAAADDRTDSATQEKSSHSDEKAHVSETFGYDDNPAETPEIRTLAGSRATSGPLKAEAEETAGAQEAIKAP